MDDSLVFTRLETIHTNKHIYANGFYSEDVKHATVGGNVSSFEITTDVFVDNYDI